MRDYIVLYVNGARHEVRGERVFQPLTDFLRYDLRLPGTKVVCAEGDCGSCTVMVGRPETGAMHYRSIDGCIQYLWQLDGRHVVTVEGLRQGAALHPVQQAMVDSFGSQCGYCTPGFVMALTDLLEQQQPLTRQNVQDGLTGNLCRCTGYEQIIEAALSIDPPACTPLSESYQDSGMIADLAACAEDPVEISYAETHTPEHHPVVISIPVTLEDALAFKARSSKTVVVSGGTDVSVQMNKGRLEPKLVLSLTHLRTLEEVRQEGNTLRIGAKATWTEVEQYCREHLPEFQKIIEVFASPQIRNAGTLVGNVGNGSPIADSMPFLYVMETEVELTGPSGVRRVNINRFYHGYKQLELAPEELITALILELPDPRETLKLYKVSKRKDLDISTVTAGFRMVLEGEAIAQASVAFGGVGPTVMRLAQTEVFLQGKRLSLEVLTEAGKLAREEVSPISDVRASEDYRLQVTENLFRKLYHELAPSL